MKATYEITAKMNLKDIIAESREVAQALNEFTDNLESIEGKYAEPKTDVLDKIKAEIRKLSPKPTPEDVIDGNRIKDAVWETLIEVDKIIDKYRQTGGMI